jgi:hypothetical protein
MKTTSASELTKTELSGLIAVHEPVFIFHNRAVSCIVIPTPKRFSRKEAITYVKSLGITHLLQIKPDAVRGANCHDNNKALTTLLTSK